MQLKSSATWPVDAETAYARLADFDALETVITGYGIQIDQRTPGWPDGVERAWKLRIGLRGVERVVSARVVEVTPPEGYVAEAKTDGLAARIEMAIAAEGDARSAVTLTVDATARGITGKVLLTSLNLARATIDAKFHDRVTAFVGQRLDTQPV